jgi:DNA repair exonuclease SbcCD ATPase subunit
LEESISFTGNQIVEEQAKLKQIEDGLVALKTALEDKRKVFDDQRAAIDAMRRENQTIQRNQFDAEKKVAVADTSIQNLQRSIQLMSDEKLQRIEQINQDGGNAFVEYQLPQAVITLKQGAGRLIRDETDRGVLMICDPRLFSKGYGKKILRSLPSMKGTRKIDDVLAFFARAVPTAA